MLGDDFDPGLWRDRLERRGEAIRWLRRLPCPCQNPTTRVVNRACPLCDGTKYLHEEQAVSSYRAIITNESPREYLSRMGAMQVGDLFCQTMPDEIPLAQWDVVIVPSRYEENQQLLTRGQDALSNWPVTALVFVRDLGQEYVVGTDCELAEDGRTITWLTEGPADGATYTARYRFTPTYDVREDLVHRRKTVESVALPQAVVLRQRTLAQGEEPWST